MNKGMSLLVTSIIRCYIASIHAYIRTRMLRERIFPLRKEGKETTRNKRPPEIVTIVIMVVQPTNAACSKGSEKRLGQSYGERHNQQPDPLETTN